MMSLLADSARSLAHPLIESPTNLLHLLMHFCLLGLSRADSVAHPAVANDR